MNVGTFDHELRAIQSLTDTSRWIPACAGMTGASSPSTDAHGAARLCASYDSVYIRVGPWLILMRTALRAFAHPTIPCTSVWVRGSY